MHRLKAKLAAAGDTHLCPACQKLVTIPIPSFRILQNQLGLSCRPLPNRKEAEYRRMIKNTLQLTQLSVRHAKYLNDNVMVNDAIDKSKRILRNISVFVDDLDLEPEHTSDPLRGIAIGDNFAGLGIKASKKRQYKNWETNEEFAPCPHQHHPLHEKCLAAIRTVESLAD